MSTGQQVGLVRFADFRQVPGGIRPLRCGYIPRSGLFLKPRPWCFAFEYLTAFRFGLFHRQIASIAVGEEFSISCHLERTMQAAMRKHPAGHLAWLGVRFIRSPLVAPIPGCLKGWFKSPGSSTRPADGCRLLRFPAFRCSAGRRGSRCGCVGPSGRPGYRCQNRGS